MANWKCTMENLVNDSFWKNKKVLVTGDSGFKGGWLCCVLASMGADVTGYSLVPAESPSLFKIADIPNKIHHITGDVRDFDRLYLVFKTSQPEIVFHLAAQPIVRMAYKEPRYTYETNVIGTVNVLESIRTTHTVKSFLNITTDKVYKNNEWYWGYRETDILDGFDPYSNSKSCSELVTNCYRNSFFSNSDISVSTARAGNVIGGGDFSTDRIIPDCIRAVLANKPIIIRNPTSIRPYQHVLEPIFAYLTIAEKQFGLKALEGSYNIGPDAEDCITTETLVKTFCNYWETSVEIKYIGDAGPHESHFLKLDSSKIKSTFGWCPRWNIEKAVFYTCEWLRSWIKRKDMTDVIEAQIRAYRGIES